MIIRILLFPIILLLVLYFVIGLVVPISKAISAQKILVAEKQKTLDRTNQRLNAVNAFVDEVNAHPDEQEFVMDFVPNDQREEIILSDVSQLAEKSGVSLFSVGFSEGRNDVRSGAAGGGAYLIEGSMIVSGTYDNFKKFSHELFHMKRLYKFKTFELAKVEEEKKEGEETPASTEKQLSGVISFAYGYIPGEAELDVASFTGEADFDFVNNVMTATTQTKPLVSQPTKRANPFLP